MSNNLDMRKFFKDHPRPTRIQTKMVLSDQRQRKKFKFFLMLYAMQFKFKSF